MIYNVLLIKAIRRLKTGLGLEIAMQSIAVAKLLKTEPERPIVMQSIAPIEPSAMRMFGIL